MRNRKKRFVRTTEPPSAFSSSTSYKPPQSSPSGFPYSSKPPPSSSGPSPSYTKQPPAFKPILHTAPNEVTNEEGKTTYAWEKGEPIYAIPEDIKGLVKRDIAPQVLKQPLSPSTYKAYFAALLYAEDYYLEKWSNFLLEKVTLKLEEAALHKKSKKSKHSKGTGEEDDKIFVEFEIDSIPEKRPFLLSRDMVYARPSDKTVEPVQFKLVKYYVRRILSFQGSPPYLLAGPLIGTNAPRYVPEQKVSARTGVVVCEAVIEIYKTSQENRILICAPINRTCDVLMRSLREVIPESDMFRANAAFREIDGVPISFQGSPPYLLAGPLIGTNAPRYVPEQKVSARTGVVVCEAVIEIYKTSQENRILICAPINRTCDVLMRSLREVIPESDMFRANAAFREIDGVPIDILRSCPVKDECFACPPLQKLRKFKIILSTFVSSFRLHNEGIAAGHFSHIFLVDASSTTEPEATIPLANFANENASVIVTGAPGNHSGWIRSNIARKYGLGKSYFERLHEVGPYQFLNPMFITEL
ncbi:uncharacterized protein LOC136061513 [Quercus suber]|uniref:uncharacterized protein LOC136061513 n=1 Tax=Quercus suber TaxID=58331 RepID=UPI0032E014B2